MPPPSSSRSRLVVAAALVWLRTDQVLLQRRSKAARHGADKLEFPGGKVEPGEAPAVALSRELGEEWGPDAAALPVGPIAEVLHHVYPAPGPEVLLCVYHVDARSWSAHWRRRIRLEPGVTAQAYMVPELPIEEFLEADRPFAARVAAGAVIWPGP